MPSSSHRTSVSKKTKQRATSTATFLLTSSLCLGPSFFLSFLPRLSFFLDLAFLHCLGVKSGPPQLIGPFSLTSLLCLSVDCIFLSFFLSWSDFFALSWCKTSPPLLIGSFSLTSLLCLSVDCIFLSFFLSWSDFFALSWCKTSPPLLIGPFSLTFLPRLFVIFLSFFLSFVKQVHLYWSLRFYFLPYFVSSSSVSFFLDFTYSLTLSWCLKGDRGPPQLTDPLSTPSLSFFLSHSEFLPLWLTDWMTHSLTPSPCLIVLSRSLFCQPTWLSFFLSFPISVPPYLSGRFTAIPQRWLTYSLTPPLATFFSFLFFSFFFDQLIFLSFFRLCFLFFCQQPAAASRPFFLLTSWPTRFLFSFIRFVRSFFSYSFSCFFVFSFFFFGLEQTRRGVRPVPWNDRRRDDPPGEDQIPTRAARHGTKSTEFWVLLKTIFTEFWVSYTGLLWAIKGYTRFYLVVLDCYRVFSCFCSIFIGFTWLY